MASLLDKLFGKKPDIPELPAISPDAEQKKAIAGNLSAMGEANNLASQTTTLNAANIERALEFALPGALRQLRDNINAQIRGQIPDDVNRSVQAASAASGFNLGLGGSQAMRNMTARDLGLTSLNLMQAGQENFESFATPFLQGTMDVRSMFFSPQERLNFAIGERNTQFQRNLMEAQIDAAPDPGARGLFDTTMEVVGMVLSAYSGGAGYKGTYKPDYNKELGRDAGGQGGEPAGGGFSVGAGSFGFGRKSGGGWFVGRQPGKG